MDCLDGKAVADCYYKKGYRAGAEAMRDAAHYALYTNVDTIQGWTREAGMVKEDIGTEEKLPQADDQEELGIF